MKRTRFIPLVLLLSLAGAVKVPAAKSGMATYETRYYTIHTDLGPADEKEAEMRMTKMAEEYHARTIAFSGQVTQRLPFYLFRNADDFYAAGAPAGSAGVFIVDGQGERLMAIAGDQADAQTWHVVQHEGFHQFAHAVILGELPMWVNEGIAEYFGEGLFTGDNFITGLVPPWRLKRLKDEIAQRQVRPIQAMMLMTMAQWNGALSGINYDQAWSMVHFLVHAEGGKYQKPFADFILSIGRGVDWNRAWQQNFGSTAGFEQRWAEYWQGLEEDPTAELYVQASCSTLESFLARASFRRQTFGSFDAFLGDATSGKLKEPAMTDWDWLPPRLLDAVVKSGGRKGVKWTLDTGKGRDKAPRIVAELTDGTRLVASATLRASPRGWNVAVEVDDLGAVLVRGRALVDQGQRDRARTLVQQALRRLPNSPRADEARNFMIETK